MTVTSCPTTQDGAAPPMRPRGGLAPLACPSSFSRRFGAPNISGNRAGVRLSLVARGPAGCRPPSEEHRTHPGRSRSRWPDRGGRAALCFCASKKTKAISQPVTIIEFSSRTALLLIDACWRRSLSIEPFRAHVWPALNCLAARTGHISQGLMNSDASFALRLCFL